MSRERVETPTLVLQLMPDFLQLPPVPTGKRDLTLLTWRDQEHQYLGTAASSPQTSVAGFLSH